jgi:hypothetical protein
MAFSPNACLAAGIDAGSGRLTLLQPTDDAIAVLDRAALPVSALSVAPAWTRDGRHILTAGDAMLQCHSLVHPHAGNHARLKRTAAAPSPTPAVALVSHPTKAGVVLLRSRGTGAALDRWEFTDSGLWCAQSLPLAGGPRALALQDNGIWIATSRQICYLSLQNAVASFGVTAPAPAEAVFAMAVQKRPA